MNLMIVHLANPARLAAEVMAEAWAPPPPVDYLGWAEANIVFSARESPLPGPYNRAQFRYFDEILRALSPDDPCRVVTVKKSAQLGGTVVANIFVCGSMAMDPGDVLYVHPTDSNAQRWSKMKLAPMLKSTTALRELFPMKSRDGSDSVLYKERVDGRGAIQISGANSPASLSQVSMRRQVQDDLSKWEINAAGDPEVQADSRSQAYELGKILKISTPLVAPGCRISKNFEAGSQEHPYVPCPHCGHMQVLTWENMQTTLDEEEPEGACFSCEDCGGIIEEHHRPQMLAGLEWRAHNPKAMREHRSFWLWSAYSILQSWERIARSWLKAKGDPAAEQVFLNDVVGKEYQASSEAPPWEDLRDRAAQSDYERGRIPAGGLVVTIGIDCQGDRVEWQAVAFGRNRDRYVIEYGVVPGHISEKGCQDRLDALMKQAWPNAVGRTLAADIVAIDGNAWTEEVWEWVRRHPANRVMMVRGNNRDVAPLLERVRRERHPRTGKLLKYSKRFYSFNASVLKMALYRNLKKADPLERGFIGFPRGLDDEYFRQLTAERREKKKNKTGIEEYRWVKDSAQANEALDTMNQAEAAALRFGLRAMPDPVWDTLEAEREAPIEAAQLDLEDLMAGRVTGGRSATSDPAPADAEKPNDDSTRAAIDTRKERWKRR